MNEFQTLSAGEVVSGKFRVERVLGEGGMALVYLATHLQLDERVALKFLRHDAQTRPDIVHRFQREARAAVKLKSEHVARVSDVGEHNGVPYMVMEYLDGANLEELVQRHGRLPVEEAIDYVIQGCDGISEAHANHIVHRDLKPANLFAVDRGDGRRVVKVLDFGISKLALTGKVSDVDLSKTSSIVGSPLYMSPEQIRSSKDVDRRTDVWALGIVLFELITGKTPFQGDDFTSLMAEILEKPHLRMAELRPDVPLELDEILDRCLAKDVRRRYQTAAELAIALLPFTRSRRMAVVVQNAVTLTRSAGLDANLRFDSAAPPAMERTSLPNQQPRTTGTPLEVTSNTHPDLRRQQGRKTVALVGLGLLCILGAVGLALGLRANKPTERSAAAAVSDPAAVNAPTAQASALGAVAPPGAAAGVISTPVPSSAVSSLTPLPSAAAAPGAANGAGLAARPGGRKSAPHAAPTPPSTPSTPQRTPDLEIRRER